jgi:hypothetical protein
MGASAGFYAYDSFGGQCRILDQEFRVFLGVNIVGDHANAVFLVHFSSKSFD